MATKTAPVASDIATPILHAAFSATSAAFQIICDLEAILQVIAKTEVTEVAQLAAIGLRIANDARWDALDDGHFMLKMQLGNVAKDLSARE